MIARSNATNIAVIYNIIAKCYNGDISTLLLLTSLGDYVAPTNVGDLAVVSQVNNASVINNNVSAIDKIVFAKNATGVATRIISHLPSYSTYNSDPTPTVAGAGAIWLYA